VLNKDFRWIVEDYCHKYSVNMEQMISFATAGKKTVNGLEKLKQMIMANQTDGKEV